jgi:hypothetical protein
MKNDDQHTQHDDQLPASDTNEDERPTLSQGSERDESAAGASEQAQREQDRAFTSGEENPT